MKPTLFWITGLSGSGKTTIGLRLYDYLKNKSPKVIFLDGDAMRAVLDAPKAHSRDERLKLAMIYARLCKMLVDQGMHVVCATISMFHDVRDWNRANFKEYIEIYIKVPLDLLIKKDSKNIYSKAIKGEHSNVVGLDLELQEPLSPHIIVVNDHSRSVDALVKDIIKKMHL